MGYQFWGMKQGLCWFLDTPPTFGTGTVLTGAGLDLVTGAGSETRSASLRLVPNDLPSRSYLFW